jgi:hypothetical protein
MEGVGFLLFAAVFWVAPIFVAKKIGDRKGRSSAWAWGVLLGWLGVLIVALLSDRQPYDTGSPAASQVAQKTMKRCPECAEEVQPDARVCRYCGHRFEEAAADV